MTIAWEYRDHTRCMLQGAAFHDSRKLLISELNALGQNGWEVCGFASSEVNYGWQFFYTFKRQKQGQ